MPSDEWPIVIDGREYQPVPESWIEADSAYDDDPGAPPEAIRLYAVSACVQGGRLCRVRYSAPRYTKVLEFTYHPCPRDDGEGYYPCGLKKPDGWPRSYVVKRGDEPSGVRRRAELLALLDLWGEELESPTTDDEGNEVIADGGSSDRYIPAEPRPDFRSGRPRYWFHWQGDEGGEQA